MPLKTFSETLAPFLVRSLNLEQSRASKMAGKGKYGLGFNPAPYSNTDIQHPEQESLPRTPTTPSLFSPTTRGDTAWRSEAKSQKSHFLPNTRHSGSRPGQKLEWYLTIPLFASGIYSTLMSGAYLGIALGRPQWGAFINSYGSTLTPAGASNVVAALAKTIELTFLTFFLAMMGQNLTRRANNSQALGVSLADLQLKVLLVLPGSIATEWRNYGRALRSLLGIAAVIACLSSMLYTTASSVLGKQMLLVCSMEVYY